jgi:Ribbon-helix-helix protein, copG family.
MAAGVTVQVRNLDPDVRDTLKTMAAREGLSLSEFVRRALTDIAEQIQIKQRWERAVAADTLRLSVPERHPRKPLHIDADEIVTLVHEGREEL